jgi:hypothetical protein
MTMADEKRVQDPSSVMPGGKLMMVRKYGRAPVKDEKGVTKEHVMYFFVVEDAETGKRFTVPWACVQSHEQYIDKAVRRMIPLGMPPTEGGEKDAQNAENGEVRPVDPGAASGEASGT